MSISRSYLYLQSITSFLSTNGFQCLQFSERKFLNKMSDIMNTSQLYVVSEEARRKTFKRWPYKNNQSCSANKMAEAGFIFTGSSREPDSVQCCFCFKPLDGWDATDSPWEEHLKHAQHCKFAQMQKQQDLWTWRELVEILGEYFRNVTRRKYEKAEVDLKNHFALLRDSIQKC